MQKDERCPTCGNTYRGPSEINYLQPCGDYFHESNRKPPPGGRGRDMQKGRFCNYAMCRVAGGGWLYCNFSEGHCGPHAYTVEMILPRSTPWPSPSRHPEQNCGMNLESIT